MSLNPEQMAATRHELQANFELTGLTKQQVAADLKISLTKLDHLFALTQQSLNDPWILRNYLLDQVKTQGKTPVPFTALSGDCTGTGSLTPTPSTSAGCPLVTTDRSESGDTRSGQSDFVFQSLTCKKKPLLPGRLCFTTNNRLDF